MGGSGRNTFELRTHSGRVKTAADGIGHELGGRSLRQSPRSGHSFPALAIGRNGAECGRSRVSFRTTGTGPEAHFGRFLVSRRLLSLAQPNYAHFGTDVRSSTRQWVAGGPKGPFRGATGLRQYEGAYRRDDARCWAEYYGVPFREPDDGAFDPRRLALACVAAAGLGAVVPFNRRLFRAIFVEGTSPLDDDACARLAAEVGLDRAAFACALDDPVTALAHRSTLDDGARQRHHRRAQLRGRRPHLLGNDRLSLVRHFALKGAARGGWPVHRRIRLIS